MTTITEARDAMVEALQAAWAASGLTSSFVLLYDNVEQDKPTGVDSEGRALPFSRISVRHTSGEQSTAGALGSRRFMSGGIVTQQVFTAVGDGHLLGDQVVQQVKNTMRALRSPNGVWVYNVTVEEIGIDGAWFQVNVSAEFGYDEVA